MFVAPFSARRYQPVFMINFPKSEALSSFCQRGKSEGEHDRLLNIFRTSAVQPRFPTAAPVWRGGAWGAAAIAGEPNSITHQIEGAA